MVILSRWPDKSPLFEGSTIAPVWARWFTALWNAVTGLQTSVQGGPGSPEAVITAPQGSIYLRTDGAAGTTVYYKSSGGTTQATLTATGWLPLS